MEVVIYLRQSVESKQDTRPPVMRMYFVPNLYFTPNESICGAKVRV